MKAEEGKALVRSLCTAAKDACEIAKTAKRNRASLAGSNFYGNKFHNASVAISTKQTKLASFLAFLEESKVTALTDNLATLKAAGTKPKDRENALRNLQRLCESDLIPSVDAMTASPIPETEQVLPLAVVANTRSYLEKMITQANGCYEHQWYDACSVMIRKFVETLIIELYEAKNKAGEIKDGSGNYFMLKDLIDKVLNDSAWHLGRETKKGLPLIKGLGDNSAHNRRFIAKQADIDKVTGALRILADELLHLAGMK